ncbi:MAG: hypothetical protein DWQ31_01295 [Planctomycetota bacterium]|nr:MAG: hypothetical protein DWQ31_01295 [Planctomycetota bacterium]REJ95913.1 MAG: hypothetical protein DWQ35_05580 [Planctomycetota bacterium]
MHFADRVSRFWANNSPNAALRPLYGLRRLAVCLALMGGLTGCSDDSSWNEDAARRVDFSFSEEEQEVVARINAIDPLAQVVPLPPQGSEEQGTQAAVAEFALNSDTWEFAFEDALAELNQLRPIVGLQLRVGNLRDADLKLLSRFDRLRNLTISSPEVTDQSLKLIGAIRSLHQLGLPGCRITDEGISSLAELDQLRILILSRTEVTGEGLASLAASSRIETLHLSESPVDDAGLAEIGRLKDLELLFLDGTQITDTGLLHLKQLKDLRTLNVSNTQVTRQGVAELQRFLPNLHVVQGTINRDARRGRN